jgi:inhibitor of cysteine peptidase
MLLMSKGGRAMSRNTVALVSAFCLLTLTPVASATALEEITGPSSHLEGCGIVCLDESDDGQTIHLRLDELVLVRLESNPSTGYDWHLEELDNEIVQSLCSAWVSDNPGLLGSPGDRMWFFQAESTGVTDLVLKYYRIWEGPDTAIKTFQLRFVVH